MTAGNPDVLLIFPPISAYMPKDPWGEYLLKLSPPMGLMYIASYLRKHGYSVGLLDGAAMSARGKSLKEAIRAAFPKLVGLSSVTINANNIRRVATFVKSVHPDCKVICGGAHPSFCFHELLNGPEIDAVVLMEGEETALELARYFCDGEGRLEEISGIAFREGDRVVVTPPRSFIKNLDALPFPARDLINLEHYSIPGVIVSSRGCPFECTFCVAAPLSGRKNRARTPENTIEEISECVERFGMRIFFFSDDCFTINTKRCERLCALISDISTKITWSCEGRVDTVNPYLLSLMKESGCFGIQYGVESGSNLILKQIRKNITKEQILQAVKWTVDAGLQAVCSLQVGHPEDTEETIQETIRFSAELRSLTKVSEAVTTDFAVTTPLPGTALRNEADKFGIRIRTNDWDQYTFIDPVMDTKHLTAEQISTYVALITTRMGGKGVSRVGFNT